MENANPTQSASAATPDEGSANEPSQNGDENVEVPARKSGHRAQQQPATEGRQTLPSRRRLGWERLSQSGRSRVERTARLVKQLGLGSWLGLGILFLVILLVYETVTSGAQFVVEPIRTPSQHAAKGYESGVIAQHLIDEIDNISTTAQAIARHHTDPVLGATTVVDEGPDNEASRMTIRTGGNTSGMEPTLELSTFASEEYGRDFTVPTVGISIKSTTTYLRDLFGLSSTVTGELISVEPDDDVVLRVRIDGQQVHPICAMGKQGTVRQVLHYGAREILCATQPLTLAAYYYANRELPLVVRLIALARSNQAGSETEAQALLLEGHLDAREGNFDSAIEKYSLAIGHNSTSVQAYSSWGNALWANEDYEEAIEKYQHALAIDSTFAPAYIGWGQVLYAQNEYVGAIAKYLQAIERNPISVRAHTFWGNALRANDNYEEAIEKYQHALAIDSTFAPAYRGWGNTLYVQRDYAGAIEQYQQAVEHGPNDFVAYFNWGNVLRATGEYEEAIKRYALAAERNPGFARVYQAWGQTLCAMSEEGAAKERFERANELGDDEMSLCSEGLGPEQE